MSLTILSNLLGETHKIVTQYPINGEAQTRTPSRSNFRARLYAFVPLLKIFGMIRVGPGRVLVKGRIRRKSGVKVEHTHAH